MLEIRQIGELPDEGHFEVFTNNCPTDSGKLSLKDALIYSIGYSWTKGKEPFDIRLKITDMRVLLPGGQHTAMLLGKGRNFAEETV